MRIVKTEEQTTIQPLREAFERLRAKRWELARTTAEERIARLEKFKTNLLARREALVEALHADFRKPRTEVETTELLPVLTELEHTVKHLKGWMKPRRVGTPLMMAGTRGEVRSEAKGVVCIIAPWNYPFLLLATPLVPALAAGNAVMLKPSEKTPHTSAFIAQLIRDSFDASEVTVAEGGIEVGEALLQLPFDHFFFTGGPRVGRRVMEAAARHLAGVTLELGGKSPVIVDASADVVAAAERVAWGKFLNDGQSCVAPDYVLVHASREEAFLAGLKAALERFYGRTEEARKESPDLSRLVDDGAFQRLSRVLDSTVGAGARVVTGGQVDAASRYIAPTVLADVTPRMPVMAEEIFGPLLPVLRFDKLDEALEQVRAGDKPLALYVFARDGAVSERVLRETTAGGSVVNNVVIHLLNPDLPFGGVGTSGLGAYHGERGFQEFSHARSVMRQGRASMAHFFYPPYTPRVTKLVRMATRFLE